jgi:hypothetical protein
LPTLGHDASAPSQSLDADVLTSRKAKKYGHDDRLLPDLLHSPSTDKQLADSLIVIMGRSTKGQKQRHLLTQPTTVVFPWKSTALLFPANEKNPPGLGTALGNLAGGI